MFVDLKWTNGQGLYRKCRECGSVQHLIRVSSGQGDDYYAGWWEDEEEVMMNYERGEYYGTGKRLSEIQKGINNG